ncbi:MAG: acetylxylan esterase [Ruminococcaceae bacterium]|nr:acetylxylan esterase [Oscillospiraceae bacterium]
MKDYMEKLINYTPVLTEYSEFHTAEAAGNIRAVTYSFPSFFKKEYETFAFIGFPENVQGKIPAVVLVHGGGGHAYAEWVRIWNARGYAAIAMDTEGYYPESADWSALNPVGAVNFTHEIPASFSKEGLCASPVNDAMQSAGEPLENQWMFHAVAKVILAQNILRSFENVEKVGVCGISWGSIITSVTLGYDPRFDFAVSIYGGGYQLENKGFCGDHFRKGRAEDKYLAEKRYNTVDTPVLFLCGDDDAAFSVDANSRSYEALCDRNPLTRFSIVRDFVHGHVAGWQAPLSYLFADAVCRANAEPILAWKTFPTGRDFSAEVEGNIQAAAAYYITKPITYGPRAGERANFQDEAWKEIPCKLDKGRVCGALPEEAYAYFVTAFSAQAGTEYGISTPLTLL